MKKITIILFSVVCLTGNAQITPGELDINFNNTGIYESSLEDNAQGSSCVAQPDGKIVFAGNIGAFGSEKYCIRRIDQSGTMDFTHVFTPEGNQTSKVKKVLLQADGKILVTGQLYKRPDEFTTETWFYVLRLNSDGTADTGFGEMGRADFSISTGKVDEVHDMVLMSDGKIAVVSYEQQLQTLEPHGAMTILMLDSNGDIDNSYGTNGMVQVVHNHVLNIKPSNYRCIRFIDNKILIAATVVSETTGGYDYFLQRFMANGEIDLDFGVGGSQFYPVSVGSGNDYVGGLNMQIDGKILLVGKSEINTAGNYDLTLLRINYDGTLDDSFGENGIVWDNYTDGSYGETPVYVAVNSNNKINVCSWVNTDTATGIAVYQFKDDGVIDSSFAEIGKSWYTSQTPFVNVQGASMLPNNNIVTIGYSILWNEAEQIETDHFFVTQWVGEEIEEASIQDDMNIENNKINLYPNPSNGIFSIETNQNVTFLKAFDVLGNEVDLHEINKNSFMISNSNSEVVLIQFHLENGQIVNQKLIKK
jgi:uncharacterized delta-60 repeat protein